MHERVIFHVRIKGMNGSSSPQGALLGKGVLKICRKFTGEYPVRSVISTKLQINLIDITLQDECSTVNLLHIFRTLSLGKTSLQGCF